MRQTTVTLPYFERDVPRQALMVEISIGQHRLLVATTHLAYPPAFSRARILQTQKTLEAIDRFAAETPVSAAILAGDFNEELTAPALQAILASKLHFRDAHSVCQQAGSGDRFFFACSLALTFLNISPAPTDLLHR